MTAMFRVRDVMGRVLAGPAYHEMVTRLESCGAACEDGS
jgi:hypothetical protein